MVQLGGRNYLGRNIKTEGGGAQMYDGDNNGPKTVGESYAAAVGASNLRVEPHRFSHADLIAASGMSPYRMGMALMRLVSEWQAGATPPKPAPTPAAKELARAAAVARVDSGIQASEEEYGGMRVADKRARRAAAPVMKHEAEMAEAEARILAARAADWHMQEHKLRFQRLKTLPAVRAALLHWAREKGWENPEQLVADTIRHFLAPCCPVCQGRKRKVMQSRAIGPECKRCRGTGEQDLQHGGRARSLLAHMKACTGQAAADLREGAHRLRRSPQSQEDRQNRRKRERIEELRRADVEARADENQNAAAAAEHFRKSLGVKSAR